MGIVCMYIFYSKQTQLFSCWAAGWLGKSQPTAGLVREANREKEKGRHWYFHFAFRSHSFQSDETMILIARHRHRQLSSCHGQQRKPEQKTDRYTLFIVRIQGTYDEIPNSCKNFLLRLARFAWIVSLAPAARECACKTIKYPLLYR